MNYVDKLNSYLEEEIEVLRKLDLNKINEIMNVLDKARLSGNKIYICGNGGSAATASHYCCDFNKGVSDSIDRKFDFVCLSDNIPTMMAVANDIGYEEIFRYPLIKKLRKGDILLGISGSGNSSNVINAMEYAKSIGCETIVFVGYDGGKMKQIADYCIHVDINNMQIAEDVHMILDHVMMYVFCHC